jgi:hypothetical protein
MIMALVMKLLLVFGVEPTQEDFDRMNQNFRDRRHHVAIDFAKTNGSLSDSNDYSSFLLNYEYVPDQKYNGISLGFGGTLLIKPPKDDPPDMWVGGGLGYYPIRSIKLYTHIGALWVDGDPEAAARVGIGYKFPFYAIHVMPFFHVQQTSKGTSSLSIGGQLQY